LSLKPSYVGDLYAILNCFLVKVEKVASCTNNWFSLQNKNINIYFL